MHVPFVDLTGPTQRVKEKYLRALESFLDRGRFILSPEVEDFENQWAKFVGVKYCSGTSSGADALFLALIAFGIGPGDEVVTQGNAYNASVTAILKAGATPRYADINDDSLTMDVSKLENLINKNTKAILPVHLYGQTSDMEAIKAVAEKHSLVVIEDCAQAHGAEFKGKMAGAWGEAGCFSFYPTKNLGAFGDAGAITLNNQNKYEEIRARRNLGQTQKNSHKYFGTNMRLDPIQAIVLSLKMEFLNEEIDRRITAAKYYNELLGQASLPLRPISVLEGVKHVYHLYVIEVKNNKRDYVLAELKNRGVDAGVYYPELVYQQSFYKGSSDPCPVAERLADSILALPFFADITKIQQDYVVEKLKEILV